MEGTFLPPLFPADTLPSLSLSGESVASVRNRDKLSDFGHSERSFRNVDRDIDVSVRLCLPPGPRSEKVGFQDLLTPLQSIREPREKLPIHVRHCRVESEHQDRNP